MTAPHRSRVLPSLALGLVVLVVAALAGRAGSEGGPLDPRNTGELGARGLVLLLEELGAEVELAVAVPSGATDVALILEDRLDADTSDQVREWVRAGGVLVVADPFSPFAPAFELVVEAEPHVAPGVCDITQLGAVQRLGADAVEFAYRVPSAATSCFGDGSRAVVVVQREGAGVVVALGSPLPLLNRHLAEADHAVLAAHLLAPVPGTRVAVVERLVGSGDRDLVDLVGDNVWLFLVQLGVAFAVLAWWKGRRLGRPVAEPQAVRIAGAELTEAVARLLERSGSPDRAARRLRSDLHRRLAVRLGAPVSVAPEALARLVVDRTGLDEDSVVSVLAGGPVGSDDDLVRLAAEATRIREAVEGPKPAAAPGEREHVRYDSDEVVPR